MFIYFFNYFGRTFMFALISRLPSGPELDQIYKGGSAASSLADWFSVLACVFFQLSVPRNNRKLDFDLPQVVIEFVTQSALAVKLITIYFRVWNMAKSYSPFTFLVIQHLH